MGHLEEPENFNMKDLYLDVSLKTCIDGASYDFTGRKTFNTKFYRDNIGFGITDINIEVNTSLQPIIDITFKDLYGNTLFGTQRGSDSDIDTSVLFNWPPPKFIFSFKGYLGRKVTWLLNLKTTNVSYTPSDGSYEIKCSFVPNQWGFLADMPVLYLLACKKLRYENDAYNGKNSISVGTAANPCTFTTDGVFSFTRIGKQVQTKTTEETKDFDLLTKQLGAVKYGLADAVLISKIIKLNEPIKGIINNVPIQNFTNFTVTSPGLTDNEIVILSKDVNNVNKLNSFLQINLKRGDIGLSSSEPTTFVNPTQTNYKDISADGSQGSNGVNLSTDKQRVYDLIDANIIAIDQEIKRRVFSSEKTQMSKLTIGEVFRELARDAGFILGSILQAGFNGYSINQPARDGELGKKELIGNCFPLYITDKGEELPAMPPIDKSKGSPPQGSYGVDKPGGEMEFVNKFIAAIGEGIAENLLSDDVAASEDGKIKNRINNLEGIRPNPYKSTYSNIVENILIRSGIIAYITRSKDPSQPGRYPQGFTDFTDDDWDSSIQSLANSDMENLTKDILSQLSFEDMAGVKRFCTFFDKLISDSGSGSGADIGTHFLNAAGGIGETPSLSGYSTSSIKLSDVLLPYDQPVPSSILDHKVIISSTAALRAAVERSDITTALNEAEKLEGLTLGQLLAEMLNKSKVNEEESKVDHTASVSAITANYPTGVEAGNFDDVPMFYNTSYIDASTLTATKVKNNGLYWTIPNAAPMSNYYVLFETSSDALATKEINVQDATAEVDIEGGTSTNHEHDRPIGYVQIETFTNKYKHEPLNAIVAINNAITTGFCLNYSNCSDYYAVTTNYLQPTSGTVQSDIIIQQGQLEAKNLAWAVYTNTAAITDGSRNLVFGPFIKDEAGSKRSLCQRIAIKTMCVAILKKITEIDEEKNNIIVNITGKAEESKNSIYKQMHTIFHQWQIIASSIQGGKDLCVKYDPKSNINLASALEKEYGLCSNHVEKGNGKTNLSDPTMNTNTLFVYDYPLSPVLKKGESINVRDSVINIEALYKPNGNTTCLNIIQQICTKNNFVFVPFPGDANSDNINEIYKPFPTNPGDERIRNYFHVLFVPSPETRTKLRNEESAFLTDYMKNSDFQNDAISIKFGSINNQIIKNISVSTDSSKPSVESILNLQRLVDKENTNRKVGMDCSMLPIYEGRSYKASMEMLGNAQVYPMQYFYVQQMPMFGGLHQIMKVSHSITPNNMTTKLEGIRMRFSVATGFGGISPITLGSLAALGPVLRPLERTSGGTLGTVSPSTYSTSDMNIAAYDITGLINMRIFPLNSITIGSGMFRGPKDFTVTNDNGTISTIKGNSYHGGVDISIPSGTQLLAPLDNGTVIHADDNANGFGGQIQIEYKNILSPTSSLVENACVLKFGHCQSWSVKRGDIVHTGQIIGISGGHPNDPHAGKSNGSHLHFEFSINGNIVDPLKYINFIGVKLSDNDKKRISDFTKKDPNIKRT